MMRMGSTPGRNGVMRATSADCVHTDLFDLQGHRIRAGSQSSRRGHIVPSSYNCLVRHIAHGATRLGIHHAYAVAHGARSHCSHAPQLAATENRYQPTRQNDGCCLSCSLPGSLKRNSPRQLLLQILSKYFLGASLAPRGQSFIKRSNRSRPESLRQAIRHSLPLACLLPACQLELPSAFAQSRAMRVNTVHGALKARALPVQVQVF